MVAGAAGGELTVVQRWEGGRERRTGLDARSWPSVLQCERAGTVSVSS